MKELTVSPKPQRVIPPVPGGGSWRFDEVSWTWQPNNPAPAATKLAAAPAAAEPTAVQAFDQPAEEE